MVNSIWDDPTKKQWVQRTVLDFNAVYYYSMVFTKTTWMGIQTLKYPTDLIIFQEIIFETKPDIIIETGTWKGGSALFMANVFDGIGKGTVITIDNCLKPDLPTHPRITYLFGDVLSEEIMSQINEYLRHKPKVMVILDSEHLKAHVLKELDIYAPLVAPGCYLILEDTFLHTYGFDVTDKQGNKLYPGPMEALREWLPKHPEFEKDVSRNKFYLTENPDGCLRRLNA
jgi:cephalosporin hydroxylase